MFEGVNYSKNEMNFFNHLFDTHAKMQSGVIGGGEVVQLFMKANVQKDKLKIIWDNSSKRKAPNLTKEEFYYACRNLALAQLDMELNDVNVKKMNASDYLPVFQGIHFNLQIEIPQPQINNQQNQPQVTPSMNDNMTSSFPMNSNPMGMTMPIPMTNMMYNTTNSNGHGNAAAADDDDDDDFVEIDEDADKEIKPNASIKQVELNIVNSLLKDFDLNKHKKTEEQKVIPSPQPKIIPVQPEAFKPKKDLNDLFSLLDTDTHKEENPLAVKDVNNDDDDEFVAIEEDIPGTTDNKAKDNIDQSSNKAKVKDDGMEFTFEPVTNIGFTHQQAFTPQPITHLDQVFNGTDMNIITMKKDEEKTPEIAKAKTVNLTDLMGGFEFSYNNDASKTIPVKEIINEDNKENQKEYNIEKSKTVEQKAAKDIIIDDDDDFCEVKEEDFKESKETPPMTQSETNNDTNPIDMIISTKLKPNQYETKPNDNTIEDNKQIQPESQPEPNTIKEKEEEKKPSHSILNFTQMDFLQEFKKEINPNDQINDDDQFEFVEEEDQSNNNNPTPQLSKPKNPIEAKFAQFKSEEQKTKFHTNLQLIFQTINKEMLKIIPLLKVFTSFYSMKCSDNNIFNDKKLSNFINGTIELLHLHNQFKGTKKFLKEKVDTNQKNYDEIISLLKSIDESKNFATVINKKKLSEVDAIKDITNDDSNDNKDCLLCLYSSPKDKIINVFGYDFHIKCINLWLNMIDPKSPFNLVN